ncbi:OsmC family protein [Pseudarthrobacter siccitolerans]
MSKSRIAEAIRAAKAYLAARPEEARYRDAVATAVLEEGLRVRVTGADGSSLVTDMVEGVGGTASAPSPGWLFRAAYASSAATLIVMRAAEQNVELSGLEVKVDSESDDRGILGIADEVPAGPVSIKITVQAESPQNEGTVREVITWALKHCPVDDAVRRPVPVELDVRITGA